MGVQLNMIGIVVSDMARSLAFYRELGLNLPAGLDDEQHAETTLPTGLRLAWDTQETIASFMPGYQPPASGLGRIDLAFLVDSPAEVDALYGRLTAAGHAGGHEPWDAVWGQRYAIVHDPDGNPVDLFAPLDSA